MQKNVKIRRCNVWGSISDIGLNTQIRDIRINIHTLKSDKQGRTMVISRNGSVFFKYLDIS